MIAIKARVISKRIVFKRTAYYKIKIDKVYKGEKAIEKIRTLIPSNHTCSGTPCIKTRVSTAACGVRLNVNTDYLFIGWIKNFELNYGYCNGGGDWDYVDAKTLNYISGGYDCSCSVVSCIGNFCYNDVNTKKKCEIRASWSEIFGKNYKCTCLKDGEKCKWSSYKC